MDEQIERALQALKAYDGQKAIIVVGGAVDIIEYVREFGKELAGIRDDPREVVLRYVLLRLEAVLHKVEVELRVIERRAENGNDSTRTRA